MKTEYTFSHHHILGMDQFSREDITHILATAESFRDISERPIKKVPALRGRTVVNLFFEASTRTRTSFEIAAKRLSADTFNFSSATSSTSKGETLIDTARNISSMHPDVIILRHPNAGAPRLISRYVPAAIVNAGDGAHQHPSQGLLDLLTVRQRKGRLDGLKIAIVGDITHSRVARSDIQGFTTMGSTVFVYGPGTLVPMYIESMGAVRARSMHEALDQADVVIVLRIQQERLFEALLPSLREYAQRFGLSDGPLGWAREDAIIMHPGPVNRGVELNPELADSAHSVILDQVTNGVAVRMALLYLVGNA
ncbi:aspartate carbamoyltransferase catalytic subunit [Desulfobulbus oralis]|uniref:Aspartate carbamoyltransferase n=1 Tax=Desulfobulbus oralis TaxID=1986146 RepID=A0A2L1GR77_9BACT|nr:aspartate carbamoyltransferase catalytic subunit [Desulfobulbus oralis]AVD72124.1 aspartate carbamoyltransferase [Desulfobulbus oralis]